MEETVNTFTACVQGVATMATSIYVLLVLNSIISALLFGTSFNRVVKMNGNTAAGVKYGTILLGVAAFAMLLAPFTPVNSYCTWPSAGRWCSSRPRCSTCST